MDLEKQKVRKAVTALLALLEKKQKPSLIEDEEKVNLQFTFKKVPDVKNKTLHLKLPHSMQRDSQDVCLFVKDLNKKKRDFDPTVYHYKELLEKHGVSIITEVIPMRSLKTEYKPYEAKRVLSDRFDVYLADKCIIRLLPDYLGKHFYGRKRIPIGVNMTAKNLKKEIEGALDNTSCTISGRGSSSMATVAHSAMKSEAIVDNVIACANQIAAGIPGGPSNIKNMYIKTGSSMSIPLYFASDEGEVVLPAKERKMDNGEFEDITTLTGAKVKVSKFGDVQVLVEKRTADDEDLDLDSFNVKKKLKTGQKKTKKNVKKKVKKMAKTPLPKAVSKPASKKQELKQPKKKKSLKSKK